MSLWPNNLPHFLSRLSFLQFLQSQRKKRPSHTQDILKMAEERSHASKADKGQINKAFGYFKKMTEKARRQPGAAPQFQHCVYLESYS